MLPSPPNLAARVRPGKLAAAALGLALALAGAAALRVRPHHPAPRACPVVTPVATPDANAADLVGIYRSAACTLTLDASGTYVSDCGGGLALRYAIAGEQIVLAQPIGARRLTISGPGRLVAADGTIYSITGGPR